MHVSLTDRRDDYVREKLYNNASEVIRTRSEITDWSEIASQLILNHDTWFVKL